MSSSAVQPNVVLTRRLADGTIEWIPIEIPQHEPAARGAAYALIDRGAGFGAPQQLLAERQGDDLLVRVNGVDVLIVDGFFVTADVTFHPVPDVAGGAGPFSGVPVTPDTPFVAASATGAQIVWSAQPIADAPPTQSDVPEESSERGGVGSPVLWGGIGLGVLALAAAGGGGGGGGGGGDGGGGTPPPDGGGGSGDSTPPQITSGATAAPIDENTGAGQVVYIATATDAGTVIWSLEGADAAAFDIDADSGEVTLVNNPDFETQPSYSFTVVATDDAGNSTPQSVTLSVNNLDDSDPFITSLADADAIDENSGANQVVYTATATDAVTWSLGPGDDASAFRIDSDSGAVRLRGNPNFESKSDYIFTVVATDDAGNSSQQAVSLSINNLDEVAPSITSAGTAAAIDENSGADQVVYTVTSTDNGDISTGATTYSLQPVNDADDFSINPNTGQVRLLDDPDFEAQSSYAFTVVATDAAGNSSARAVTLAINNLDEGGPTVQSVALTAAVGAQNGILNAGDTVRVTATMSENTLVDTSAGSPRIALNIGGSTVFAGFVSGGGTASLVFEYVIQAGNTDANGISIGGNSLQANGGILRDASGNTADLSHSSVGSNAAFVVDTTAPTLTSSSPTDDATGVAVDGDIVLQFSEAVQAGSGAITISNGSDTRVIDATDASQVSINGNQVTIDPSLDLNPLSNYSVRIENTAFTDAGGNAYAGIGNTTALNFETESVVDTTVVVFDLVQGTSSDHSGRTFQNNVSYDIYIRVDSDSASLSDVGGGDRWSGANRLGSDDRIILVGNGAPVEGPFGLPVASISVDEDFVAWQVGSGFDAAIVEGRSFTRVTGGFGSASDTVRLFDRDLEQDFLDGQGGNLNTMYLTTMPAGILTSQGLV